MKLRGPREPINLITLAALVVAPFAHSFATTANFGQRFVHREPPSGASLLGVLGDFDGDRRIDRAELHLAGAHRCILVRYGNSRESHLELRETSLPEGTLLARDINGDCLTDLIWIFSAPSEAGRAWLGDGAGHFSRSDDVNVESLRAELFGSTKAAKLDNSAEQQVCLTPEPIPCEPVRSAHLPGEARGNPIALYRNRPVYPGPHLSILRERGPPVCSGS